MSGPPWSTAAWIRSRGARRSNRSPAPAFLRDSALGELTHSAEPPSFTRDAGPRAALGQRPGARPAPVAPGCVRLRVPGTTGVAARGGRPDSRGVAEVRGPPAAPGRSAAGGGGRARRAVPGPGSAPRRRLRPPPAPRRPVPPYRARPLRGRSRAGPWRGPRSRGAVPRPPGAPCAPSCAATCPQAPSAWWSSPCWRCSSSSTSCSSSCWPSAECQRARVSGPRPARRVLPAAPRPVGGACVLCLGRGGRCRGGPCVCPPRGM